MARRYQLIGLAAIGVVATMASACSGPGHSRVSSAVTRHFKGVPTGVSTAAVQQHLRTQKPWAAWAGSRSISVMTWGSGSCPSLPSSVEAAGADQVVVHTVVGPGDVCTSDLAITTSVVRLPSRVDTRRVLVVQIDGTSTRLPARTA